MEDIMDEKFAHNDKNFLKKVLHTDLYYYLMNESHLKLYVERILTEKKSNFVKNYVDFPFFADFVINFEDTKVKRAIMVKNFKINYLNFYIKILFLLLKI